LYADFAELFKALFGINIPVLSLLKTFGFLVALSFIAAGYTLYLELKRKYLIGQISDGYTKTITIDTRINPIQYLIQLLIGALIGYKVGGMFLNYAVAAPDPLSYIGSMQGSVMAAIIFGVGAVLIKYVEQRQDAAKYAGQQMPIIKQVKMHHHYSVGDIALVAAVSGFVGAKLFNAFETWDQFIADPIGSLISSSGLTFYGGLILATISLYIYTRKRNLSFKHLCDAAAPGLILAYGIGRLGCQVSGDGDWGIYNSAYVTNINGQAVPAQDSNAFEQAVQQYNYFFMSHHDSINNIPNAKVRKPESLGILPHWLFAYSYPHNVNNVGIKLNNCSGNYCHVLPVPVFPTPLYEFAAGVLIFTILWQLRKRLSTPLDLFGVYLILNGIERYAIESIRVNSKYSIGNWNPTQAELIALSLMLIGLVLLIFNRFAAKKQNLPKAE
jgi:phosphatidylglycerol---prolipoprotein diacylglyceryl transferase